MNHRGPQNKAWLCPHVAVHQRPSREPNKESLCERVRDG